MENKDFETLFDEEMMRVDSTIQRNGCKETFDLYKNYVDAGSSEEQASEIVKLMISKMIEVAAQR